MLLVHKLKFIQQKELKMKNLLLIMFVSSLLVFINSANALECPGIVKNTRTGNIVNLSEVDILDNENVKCIYNYTSWQTGKQATYTFNYNDHSYKVPTGINSSWTIGSTGLQECTTGTSKNPADCPFENANLTTYVQQLQRCPDSISTPDKSNFQFEFGQHHLSYGGKTECIYAINNGQALEGLYFDSNTGYRNNFWSENICWDLYSGYDGNPNLTNPDHCPFYLAN